MACAQESLTRRTSLIPAFTPSSRTAPTLVLFLSWACEGMGLTVLASAMFVRLSS